MGRVYLTVVQLSICPFPSFPPSSFSTALASNPIYEWSWLFSWLPLQQKSNWIGLLATFSCTSSQLSVSQSRLSSASHPGRWKLGPPHGRNLAHKCCMASVFRSSAHWQLYIPSSWMPVRCLVAGDVFNIHCYFALWTCLQEWRLHCIDGYVVYRPHQH